MDLQKEAAILEQKIDNATAKGLKICRQEGILIGHQKDKIEGIAEGEQQAKTAVAKNLLSAGISTDIISQTTGLSFDNIKQLQAEKTT